MAYIIHFISDWLRISTSHNFVSFETLKNAHSTMQHSLWLYARITTYPLGDNFFISVDKAVWIKDKATRDATKMSLYECYFLFSPSATVL